MSFKNPVAANRELVGAPAPSDITDSYTCTAGAEHGGAACVAGQDLQEGAARRIGGQWIEVVVYKSLLYLPLAILGFGYTAVMTHAIFGTLIGHLFWTLHRFAGVTTRVLDGGTQRWKATGGSVEAGIPAPAEQGNLRVQHDTQPPPQHWDALHAWLASQDRKVLLDARSAAEYAGDRVAEGAARGGHIPGARHLEWLQLLRASEDDTRLRDPRTLRATFASRGVEPGTAVLAYCQSGARAAVTWFALHQAGLAEAGVRNYDGSWAEYSRLRESPRGGA